MEMVQITCLRHKGNEDNTFEDANKTEKPPITNVDGFKLKGGLNSFIF